MANGITAGINPALFWNLVRRQVRQDYLENITGFTWLFVQPLMLLGVYAFVFTNIFKARIPEAEGIGFVPYLAVAFWPWTAFSEAIIKGGNSVTAHAALIGKAAFASELLPLATVSATFFMHMAGYVAVLLILQFTGTPIHWQMLMLTVPVLVLLWLLACAITLVVASSQVFIRDIAQIVPPVMTFWFFTSPILYSPSFLPAQLQTVFAWNPMNWFVGSIREQLLFGAADPGRSDLAALLLIPVLLWIALMYFRRFSGHFEDFL